MREIRKRYTKSDLTLLAWDSQQKAYNMSKRFADSRRTALPEDRKSQQALTGINSRIVETDTMYLMPEEINNGVPIPKKFFDEEGNLDLSRGTGEEVRRYMEALGVSLPPIMKL